MSGQAWNGRAGEAVDELGAALIGRRVLTIPMGHYPGGEASVVGLSPDPHGAPEIVLDVEHPTFGRVGVFEYEPITVLPREGDAA